jgi:hypothetical protein
VHSYKVLTLSYRPARRLFQPASVILRVRVGVDPTQDKS